MTQPVVPCIAGLQLRPGPAGRLMVSFAYHPDTVTRIKTIPGRQWHPEDKCWSIPHTDDAVAHLKRLFTTRLPASVPPPRPAALSKRRWEQLSTAEQAVLAPVEEELKLRGYSPRTRKS